MDATKPYKFIGFGAMDATKPYRVSGGGVAAPPPYACEKVKIRLLRGRSDFDVLKNRQHL
jgi:hypothetical protein